MLRSLAASFVVLAVACLRRGPAEEPRYPGFCLNPVTGEAQPRYDELCPDGGIVCPYASRVSGLHDGPGMGFHCGE